MRRASALFLLSFFLFSLSVFSEEVDEEFNIFNVLDGNAGNLLRDLELVSQWEENKKTPFPVYLNNYTQVGYFSMPSSRMLGDGSLAAGGASIPPYSNYGICFQPFSRLEIAGNYRVFRGVEDRALSSKGFGDYADKGANFKISLLQPEDSNYRLPGIAVGMEDFMGSKLFSANYIVFTKVWPDLNFECSFGYGNKRFDKWFGGLMWMPLRGTSYSSLKDFALVAEYDATVYESAAEPHPEGRIKNSPINYGLKYRLWDVFDMSISNIRGDAWAAAFHFHHGIGGMRSVLPKIGDSVPYVSPKNKEPLGLVRNETALRQDFVYSFKEQGFKIFDMKVTDAKGEEKNLWLRLENEKYRHEKEAYERIVAILKAITPDNMNTVVVVIESEDLPSHSYVFHGKYLRQLSEYGISDYEHKIITPAKEVTYASPSSSTIYHKKKSLINLRVRPKWQTYFGSASGKFKYFLGVKATVDGYLANSIYYNVGATYNITSSISDVGDKDQLNPSQLLHVQSDKVRYRQESHMTIDEIYLQKHWNMGTGWYSRIAAGHFETTFGGVATELLYYPVGAPWAIGFEGAVVKKRRYTGLNFFSTVRQFEGPKIHYRPYTGYQGFVDFYYHIPYQNMDLKVRTGRFLAKDNGVRIELGRTFTSGLTISFWHTVTDGGDIVGGERYFDKGVSFSMPLDIFLDTSSKERWGYGMAAWLRDVGTATTTGKSLHSILNPERRH